MQLFEEAHALFSKEQMGFLISNFCRIVMATCCRAKGIPEHIKIEMPQPARWGLLGTTGTSVHETKRAVLGPPHLTPQRHNVALGVADAEKAV